MNLLAKITKTHLLLLFMTVCFMASLFALYEKAGDTAEGTDYTITVTRRASEPVTPQVSGPVDINTATLDQLQTLKGVGPALAQRIIDYREEHGPFTSVEDLLHVKGIGEATLNKFRDHVTVLLPPEREATEDTTPTEEFTG